MTAFRNAAENASTARFSIKRIEAGAEQRVMDTVAVEAPLTIFLTYWSKDKRVTESLAITMRTPGNDCELAAGYLLGEGIVRSRGQIVDLQQLGSGEAAEVRVEVTPDVEVDAWRVRRTALISSACGICGQRIFESLPDDRQMPPGDLTIDSRFVSQLPERLESHQEGFAQTGGLHAAALLSLEGAVEAAFEDVGRHNAVDKVIGESLLKDRLPLTSKVLFLSSRASYELVQKAIAAGVPVLATVGGPSSLAIEAARHFGITLIGFVRGQRFNLYAGEWRVKL